MTGSNATADLLLPTLHQEFTSESAASLGAAHRILMKAMQMVADLEPQSADGSLTAAAREAVLSDAAHALWCFVVQREACGFRNTEAVLREMNIPPAVRVRVGACR